MIDDALFRRLFGELAAIGADPDGWNRLAWGPGEDAARAWFRQSARALGLDVLQDPAGSLWAVEPDASGPWVASGSHADTVPSGGAYDGALGVVCALVAVAAVRAAGGPARLPLAVGCLVDEEGARFGNAIFAARALCGELRPDELELRDAGGERLGDLAAARGVTPATLAEAPAFRSRLDAWIEVHVEQGRRLVDVPAPLGIGTGLARRERWTAVAQGEAGHAGTTPMPVRRDAFLPAARAALAADRLARAEDGVVATIGRVEVRPGATNVIPGEVRFTLDVRAEREEPLARVRDGIQAESAGAAGVAVSWRRETADPGATFDPGLRQALSDAAAAEGVAAVDLAAYAGHDAGVLSRRLPAAMLFVRNPTGASHHPSEHASDADSLAACAVLARVLAAVARR